MAKTITVRIALGINAKGEWYAYGQDDAKTWDEAMQACDPVEAQHRFWVVAEVPLPEPVAVNGRAEKDPADVYATEAALLKAALREVDSLIKRDPARAAWIADAALKGEY
jgi:hypothetical protein